MAMIRSSIKTLERVYKHYYFIIRDEVKAMEQRQNTVLTEKEKEKMRHEIMNIQDRKKRHEAIARNMNLFTNKKER